MKEEFFLESRFDALGISVAVVRPEGEAVTALQLVHGMCGSKERFLPFMEYMAGKGIACVASDHRGHGDSVRERRDLGYMYGGGAEALVDDMSLVAEWMKSEYPDLPLFMLGHSMGSLALRAYIGHSGMMPDGLILCGSPAYSPLAPATYRFSRMMCRIGFGRQRPQLLQKIVSESFNHNFRSEGSKAWVSSDPAVSRLFSDNQRHNFTFTYDGNSTLMKLMIEAYSIQTLNLIYADIPILFLSGEDDACMGGLSGLDKAVVAIRGAGFRNVGVKIYPAMRHEILNEIGKERVWQDILDFMQK